MAGIEVLVVGSGGREHALALGLSKSDSISKVHCAPGNAGTSMVAVNHQVPSTDIEGIVELAVELSVSLVVVGPEAPLVNGLSDRLRENSIPSFGPHSEGALLEGSKLHSKMVMQSLDVPTGSFLKVENLDSIEDSLETFEPPWVIKRDVLAGGKGVTVTSSKEDAREALKSGIEIDGFVLIEEHLSGEEASILVIMDESGYVMLPPSQDHKRVGNNDTGPNTGGMGAYAPSALINDELDLKIIENVIKPTFEAIKDMGEVYKGFLYVGLMIKDNNPYLVEYNVRMGDPECQTILPLLSSDLLELMLSCCEENLENHKVEWKDKKSICIVLCSNGYPDTYKKNVEIPNLEKITSNNTFIYHAGTELINNKVYAIGGRVLNFVSISNDLKKSRESLIYKIENFNWKNGFYRKDIGFKIIDK